MDPSILNNCATGFLMLLMCQSTVSQLYGSNIIVQNDANDLEQLGIEITNSCVTLRPESILKFHTWIKVENMKYISFELDFQPRGHVNTSKNLFIPDEWIWTYSGMEQGAFNMITYPFEFDLLSCGLLGNHVKRFRPYGDVTDPSVRVTMNLQPPDCLPPLGTNETDLILQRTFQQLVKETDYENNSMFCYEVKFDVREDFGEVYYYLSHFFGVQKDYTGYRCCPSFQEGCNVSVSQTNYLWILQFYGVLVAVFSPLMLRCIPEVRHDNHEVHLGRADDMVDVVTTTPLSSEVLELKWIYVGDSFSFGSVLKWLFVLNKRSMLVHRIRRVIFVHLTLIVILIRTLVFYYVKKFNVKVRIDNDVPVGHLCIPFGFQHCVRNTMYFLGGPMIYLPLYLFFTCLFLCVPYSIPRVFLSCKELNGDIFLPVNTFLYITDGTLQERKIIRTHENLTGYQKLSKKLQDRFSMLATRRFWRFFFSVWGGRFQKVNCVKYVCFYHPRGFGRCILLVFAVLPTITVWSFLVLLCLSETLLVILYYGCPMLFFIKLSISGFLSLIFNTPSFSFSDQNRRWWLFIPLFSIASVIIFSVLLFVIVVGVFQFIVSFTFILRIISFTFVGMVVYPDIALTYFLAVLTIIYYVTISFKTITDGYIILLNVMVKVSRSLEEERWRPGSDDCVHDEYRCTFTKENPATGMLGVPKDAFDDVIETVRPLRMQIIGAIVKLFITANVIYSSIVLIRTFHQGQNISLPVRTIAVIFVAFLPEILGVFQSKFREKIQETQIENYIKSLVKKFWISRYQLEATEEV